MQTLLSLNNISCERDERILFSGVNHHCAPGSLLQILGFNGAGKSTLLHTLAGLRPPCRGEILYQGVNIRKSPSYRQSLLFLGHQAPVKPELTVLENIHWLSSLLPNSELKLLDYALNAVDLDAYADTYCSALSAGQRRRVALAQVYMSRADVWILDEPFTAIDVTGVAGLSGHFQRQAERGGLVVFTSHQTVSLTGIETLDLSEFQGEDKNSDQESAL